MVTIVKGTRDFDKMPTINGNDIVPAGGSSGQVLAKNSGTDYDYSWSGSAGFPVQFSFLADSWDLPLNADWAVNAFAPAARDSNNAAMLVRRFDDSTEEGVGTALHIPHTATNLTWEVYSRAETSNVGATNVITKFYHRQVPDNGAIPSWTAVGPLTAIAIPSNELWQVDVFSGTLASFGLTPGEFYMFEYTRDAGNASDTLVGDWTLLTVNVEFS